jgi:hypothetical protein
MFENNSLKKDIYNTVLILQPALIFVLVFILQLEACPLWGQVLQRKELRPSDYHLWNEMISDKISANGQWATYKLSYLNNGDTLFVQNLHSGKTYSLATVQSSIFTNDNYFIAFRQKVLSIINLETGSRENIKDVVKYSYSRAADLLIFTVHQEAGNDLLIIRTPTGIIRKEIKETADFSLSPNDQDLAYSVKTNNMHAVRILDLKFLKNEKWIVLNAKHKLEGFTWQKEGKSIAFYSKTENKTVKVLFYYLLKRDKLYLLNSDSKADFPADSLTICERPEFVISDDIQRVFFNVVNKAASPENKIKSDVEIWNANDKWVYLDDLMHGRFETALKSALWMPEAGTFKLLSTDSLPKISLNGTKEYAILSNPKDYEPQFDHYSPRDYYIVNLRTFEKTLFIKKLASDQKININHSPGGNFIAYFKDGAWWAYSIKENKHINITSKIQTKFTAKEEDFKRESVCGSPGWSEKDEEILLYDQYDLWAVKPDGSSYRRLTQGRESKIRYRISDIPAKTYLASIYEYNHTQTYNLDKGIYLRGEGDDGKTGYFQWKNDSRHKTIVYRDSYIDQPLYSPEKKIFIFREQKFDLSPQLILVDKAMNYKPFYQSNPQQKKYFWGRSELIRYQNSKGLNLRGVLIYPANYKPEKKYPMIVHVYGVQSNELHLYTNPSQYNETGFNRTNFNLQGYFILLPDIIQEYQNVGASVVDCISKGVEKVLEKNIVDPQKVGLIGFSSGGYESAFTVTQSSLFAAVIAGGANTDLNSLYFTMGRGATGKPEMWRLKSTYFMIDKTPYEAPELYDASSPIFHVQKVKTPLLLWCGKLDAQVDARQSMEFYLALRRFGKKNIMLQYPEERHTLLKPINQLDITSRVQDWFDYYLKETPCKWVENGTK